MATTRSRGSGNGGGGNQNQNRGNNAGALPPKFQDEAIKALTNEDRELLAKSVVSRQALEYDRLEQTVSDAKEDAAIARLERGQNTSAQRQRDDLELYERRLKLEGKDAESRAKAARERMENLHKAIGAAPDAGTLAALKKAIKKDSNIGKTDKRVLRASLQAAEAKLAAEKKAKDDGKKPKPEEVAACTRKVITAAQALIQNCAYAILASRWEILFYGKGDQNGFFQELAETLARDELGSFYVNVGSGTPEEIQTMLRSLLILRDVEHMVASVEDQGLVSINEGAYHRA